MSRAVLFIAGARPNFVKLAPVLHALSERSEVDNRVLHTGQHYDFALAGSFLEQLGFPQPAYVLGVGSGTHAEQTAGVMIGLERVLAEDGFAAVIVAGDVNSTMGAALAAAKACVPVVHVEAGLRSRDPSMPEEINRIVTDRVSSLLLCHCQEAVDNLAAEGAPAHAIALVGNTMIDSLFSLLDPARAIGVQQRLGVTPRGYALVTLHRPALVDDADRLGAVIDALRELASSLPVIFPVHPRTRARLAALQTRSEPVCLIDPLEYLEFIALESQARLVITDSGGIQEETSALGVPCITYRANTERPITMQLGTNRLVPLDPQALRAVCQELLAGPFPPRPAEIPLWDGEAGMRAADAVAELLERGES